MKYAKPEFAEEILDAYFPYFGVLSFLERQGIDWSLLDKKLIDAIDDYGIMVGESSARKAKAKLLGTILRLLECG